MGSYIAYAVICGVITYVLADKRGLKNPILWGIGGAVFTIFAVGAVGFVKKKIKEKKDSR